MEQGSKGHEPITITTDAKAWVIIDYPSSVIFHHESALSLPLTSLMAQRIL